MALHRVRKAEIITRKQFSLKPSKTEKFINQLLIKHSRNKKEPLSWLQQRLFVQKSRAVVACYEPLPYPRDYHTQRLRERSYWESKLFCVFSANLNLANFWIADEYYR